MHFYLARPSMSILGSDWRWRGTEGPCRNAAASPWWGTGFSTNWALMLQHRTLKMWYSEMSWNSWNFGDPGDGDCWWLVANEVAVPYSGLWHLRIPSSHLLHPIQWPSTLVQLWFCWGKRLMAVGSFPPCLPEETGHVFCIHNLFRKREPYT